MDKLIPIIYMAGVFLLIFPAFMNSNNNFKILFTNLSIWVAIILVAFSLYYFYNLYLDF